MAATRRVRPLASLNPYSNVRGEEGWTIKVCVTNKGTMQTYSNSIGVGCAFHLELTDQDVRTHTHTCLVR